MADQKITALTEDTAPTADDLIVTVNDPAGTPANRKVTMESLTTELNKSAAHASAPSAGWTGRQFWPTDSFFIKRDNNTLLVPYGPMFPFVEPISGDYSWVNQGNATVATTNGGVVIRELTGGAAAYRIAARVKSAPSAPYTITAAFLMGHDPAGRSECGICWRQSSDGKLVTFGSEYYSPTGGGNSYMSIMKMTNPTTFSASYAQDGMDGLTCRYPIFLRIQDDNTNRKCHFSENGQDWIEVHSVARTDFMTADQVGFYVNALTTAVSMTLLHWSQA